MACLQADALPVPVVDIDDCGTFKYVLIRLSKDKMSKEDAVYLVRGHNWASYHADLVEECEGQIYAKNMKVRVQCVGGGRIRHDRDQKHINVYGYSMGFGKADHAVTCKILKTVYSDYTIDWSNEGY